MWDRHGRRLGLFDHGFCFPADLSPDDRVRTASLVKQRRFKAIKISDDEIELIRRVLSSGDLLGIAPLLEPARTQAMMVRLKRLVATKERSRHS